MQVVWALRWLLPSKATMANERGIIWEPTLNGRDNRKGIPDEKAFSLRREGPSRWSVWVSDGWWGHGSPSRRRLVGPEGRPASPELRHGPDTFQWQQSGILVNGRKPEPAIPQRDEGVCCKAPMQGIRMRFPDTKLRAISVPAHAVIPKERGMLMRNGCKASLGGFFRIA